LDPVKWLLASIIEFDGPVVNWLGYVTNNINGEYANKRENFALFIDINYLTAITPKNSKINDEY